MADRNGLDLRRSLASADCLRESAISLGSCNLKTPAFKSKASLDSVTSCDHFFFRDTVMTDLLFSLAVRRAHDSASAMGVMLPNTYAADRNLDRLPARIAAKLAGSCDQPSTRLSLPEPTARLLGCIWLCTEMSFPCSR